MKTKSLLVFAAIFWPAALVFDQSADDFTFSLSNNAITITGYKGQVTRVSIPAAIVGIPVQAIEESAFWGNKKITSLPLPSRCLRSNCLLRKLCR